MKFTRQWLRHSVQFVVLVLIVLMPMLAWFDANLDTGRVDRLLNEKPNNVQYKIASTIDGVYRPLTNAKGGEINPANQKTLMHERLARVRGNTWAGELFGYSIMDPLAGVESMVSGRSVLVVVLGGLCIPFAFTVLFGRVYCSWLCPAGFLFEVNQGVRKLLVKLGLPKRQHTVWRGHKYVLLGVGLVMSCLMSVPILGYFYPPALIGREVHRGVFGFMMHGEGVEGGMFLVTWVSVFLAMLLVVELFAAERLWCKALCPGGALYALLGKYRIVRVKRIEFRCTHCTDCVPACPMGLNPMQDQFGMDCDNCMACISSCPDNALKMRLSIRDDIHTTSEVKEVPLTTHAT